MTDTATDMMTIRRAALDALRDGPVEDGPVFGDILVAVGDHVPPGDPADEIPPGLACAVADRLDRSGPHPGPGAAVVTGLANRFTIESARAFHERLFRAVWDRLVGVDAGRRCRVKTGVIADGAIPVDLYGSRWSFKRLHIDREVVLFSHLYGPVTGFTGGSLLLVDIRPYLRRHKLGFIDVFEWSDEPTEGSKPVLRADHHESALAECGIDLGPVGPDVIVFVNNAPDAGILHGVTPVEVTAPDGFQREYHRCSVKELRE